MAFARILFGLPLIVGLLLAACGGEEAEPDTRSSAPQEAAATATTSADLGPTSTPADAEVDSTSEEQPTDSDANVDYAPEFGSIDNWYNAEPVSLEALRGQPVLLVFWADI